MATGAREDDTSRLLGHRSNQHLSTNKTKLRDFVLGITLLLLVVGLWTAGSFITNDIETGNYNKPWLLTYLGTASFSLYLLRPAARRSWHIFRRFFFRRKAGYVPLFSSDPASISPTLSQSDIEEEQALRSTWSTATSIHPELTTRQIVSLAFEFCLLWFAANYTLALALACTSVSSVTILSATSGFFALAFGHVLGFSPFTVTKLCAVLVSILGVVLVSKSDSEVASDPDANAPSNPLWGDFLSILSAIFYACYVSLVKFRAGDESRLDMPYFLGLVGLINTLMLWPVGLALHVTGIEPFELPSGNMLILAIFINSMITFTSDFFYLVAMLLTSPLTVTLGLSLTIPLAVVGDILLGHAFGGFKAIAGAVLVVASFILVGIADSQEASNDEAGGPSGLMA